MEFDLDAIRRAYQAAPDEAVLLERARILKRAPRKYPRLPPGLCQGRIIADLCRGVPVTVEPGDVFAGRVKETVPTPETEIFIHKHPELFTHPGLPGWLDSADIYIPHWGKLLQKGIGGLLKQVDRQKRKAALLPACKGKVLADYAEGIQLALKAVSGLLNRYAEQAEQLAGKVDRPEAVGRLQGLAQCCRKVSLTAPDTLYEALQLFAVFHLVLACLIGARNVTPGRMDQYLYPFYRRDRDQGIITDEKAVGLLAAVMLGLSQLVGKVATDFQSTKRTPNRYSHFYITVGGADARGVSAVNELSGLFLDALPLVGLREPSILVRHAEGQDPVFWHKALEAMRSGLPVLTYNDRIVIRALRRSGMPGQRARGYAHCGCLNCFIPASYATCLRNDHNAAACLLRALNGGRDLASGKRTGAVTHRTSRLRTFNDLLQAFRQQLRSALNRTARQYSRFKVKYPLLALPLVDRWPDLLLGPGPGRIYADQHLVGLATVVDSLLVIQEAVYRSGWLSLKELVGMIKDDFKGNEPWRRYLAGHLPSHGQDSGPALAMTTAVGRMWVEEVERTNRKNGRLRFRPGFHSWLYNLEYGRRTLATPNGRLAGEPLSSDQLPTPGRSGPPTATLRALACLPHDHTCSGGTTFRLDPAHFKGEAGLNRLRALIETYFAEGGLQLHLVMAGVAQLRDALEHPEKHADLLIRVTGFSEYFVRLLPHVQQDVIRRYGHD